LKAEFVENVVEHVMFARRGRPLIGVGCAFKLLTEFFPLCAGKFLFFTHQNNGNVNLERVMNEYPFIKQINPRDHIL
jgi:hypothetical protein